TFADATRLSRGEWPAYGATNASHRYSPLDQINKDTVAKLRIAWRQSATPTELREGRPAPSAIPNYQNTPIMVGGLLYVSSGYGTVAALNPENGRVVWFDNPPPGPNGQRPRGSASRGVTYWTDGKDERIISILGPNLIALNAKTGARYRDFGV